MTSREQLLVGGAAAIAVVFGGYQAIRSYIVEPRAALVQDYDVAPARLEAHGVGPLVPVFSNGTDGGKAKNRRVELVEK